MDTLGTSILSIVRRLSLVGGRNVLTIFRQGVNSVSIVGRSSTLQSVHYQRFHGIIQASKSFLRNIFLKIFFVCSTERRQS